MRLRMLGPRMPITVMARRMNGKASCMSASRITAWSQTPPRTPARRPRTVPVMPSMSTAANPMRLDVRAPKMSRLRMSRPSWSVPSTAKVPSAERDSGGVKRARSRCSVGSIGARSCGTAAQSPITTRIAAPTRAPAEARRMPSERARRSGKADPRVERHVDEVDQDVEEEYRRAHGEDHRLDQRHVLVDDGLDGEAADARVGEHRLRDDGAAQEVAQFEPQRRHDRDRAVP